MFGEWGNLILQFAITVVVVLGLIAVVYWLVRRYSAGGLGRLSRGRVPRLAVIDAMAVDGRRRLVLVRRDNVEHLILIGGPSDLVVEQAIQRPRQRPVTRPQAAAPAEEARPAQTEPPNLPPETLLIPFPQARVHQPAAHPPTAPAGERGFVPLRRASQSQPARAEPASIPMSAATPFEAMVETAPPFPDPPPAEMPPVEEPRPPYASYPATNGQQPPPMDFGGGMSAPAATSPFASPATADPGTAAKVNDLEREMARLLGEITARRPS